MSEVSVLLGIDNVPAEHWDKLAGMKIFFAHQSVGFDIVNGLEDVIRRGIKVKLNVVETSSPMDFARPVFAHSLVGKNTLPMSKIDGFVEIMANGLGDKVDIAILKFCYVDITHNQDHREIFEAYKAAIARLQQRYPRVRFVHFTVPLNSPPKGIKKTVGDLGRWFFRIPTVMDDNLRREQYNTLVREEYGKTGGVFDLAFVESVGPDGLQCYVAKDGQKTPFMAPQYTYDGEHLNELGRRTVAEQLLAALSKCAISGQ